MALIEVKNVNRIYKEGALPVTALNTLSLSIDAGSFAALSGPSGSGKTTLLNLLGCLDQPTSGEITFDGERLTGLSQKSLSMIRLRKIGFVFQDFNLIQAFTAIENIEYVLWLQGVGADVRHKRAMAVCTRFGIEKLINRRPHQMSRGQQQRVAVARAIVHEPRVVFGDELTANLDQKTGAELMDFLKTLNHELGITFVYATHDPVMLERADRVVRMQDGSIVNEAR